MVLQQPVETFMLPKLFSHHLLPAHIKVNRHHKQVAKETKRWLFKGVKLTEGKKYSMTIDGLKHGLFGARTYPYAGLPQLQVCTDFLVYMFYLDDISDDMDNRETGSVEDVVINSLYHPDTYGPGRVGKMTRECVLIIARSSFDSNVRSIYKRIIITASQGTQRRFIGAMEFSFHCLTKQAHERVAGIIPDLESYIALRRGISGCLPCFALIECDYRPFHV